MTEVIDIFSCCDVCGEDHPTEECPELGEIPTDSQLGGYLTRARLTLPNSFELTDHRVGTGVVAREVIPAKTQLGPFEAKKTTHVFDDTGFFTLKLVSKDGNSVCLDTTDENECNWLCLVRPAMSEETQNCMAYQLAANIYYNTTRDIFPGEELRVWYTPTYARKVGKRVLPDGVSKALLGHRIEPIQSELVIEPLDDENSEMTQTQEQTDGQNVQNLQNGMTDEDVTGPRGEIKKAHCCPRCPSTFASQTAMVRHLREHIISRNKPLPNKKRGRGRPRLHIKPDTTQPLQKKPRGRPRKAKPQEDYREDEYDSDTVNETTGDTTDGAQDSKENEENDDYDKAIDGEEIGNDDDGLSSDGPTPKRIKTDDSLVLEDDTDRDYSPMKDVTTSSGRRVQPRRQSRGMNRHLMQDYIVGKIKKESTESTENEHGVTNVDTAVDRPYIKQATVKRKRGRPKKSEQLKLNSENVIRVSNGIVQLENPSIVVNVDGAVLNVGGKDGSDTQNRSDNVANVNNITVQLENPSNVENVDGAVVDVRGQSGSNNTQNRPSISTETTESTNDEKDTGNNSANGENTTNVNDKSADVGACRPEGIGEHSELEERPLTVGDEIKQVAEKSTEASLDNEEDDGRGFDSLDNSTANLNMELVVHFDEITGQYSCPMCSEKFEQEFDAATHVASHNTDAMFHCLICNQEFPTAQDVKLHLPECKSNKSDDNNAPGEEGKTDKRGNSTEPNSGPHVCDICQQEFSTAMYLYRHMVMHTDIFSCRVCFKTFSRKDSMQKHVLKCCPGEAKRLKILHCDLCLRVFSTASGRKKHMAMCTLVQCQTCGGRFSSKEDLSEHKCKDNKSEDSASGRYSCGKCPKSFQSLHYLKQHALLHKKLHACSRCGKSLPSKEELESHSLTCQTIEYIKLLGQGRCERCGEVFTRVKMFREHALSHTHPYQCSHCLRRFIKVGTLSSHDCVNQTESFKCQTCSKSFKNEQTLDQHVKEHGCLRYQCSACSKQFYMKAEARDHECEESADGDGERKILYTSDSKEVCSTCGKTFATRSNLVKHMTLHGEKNFPCPHCEKRFHLDVYLKEHIACVHYRIYKYQCQQCGKMLKSKTGLNMHTMLFHTNKVERYPCTECPKIFKSRGNLKAHMYRHSSERRFKCHVCQRAFKFPDQLSRHKVEHKIVEKIGCMFCEKQFCRRYELKRHLQIYHSGYVYVCGVCTAKCSHRHTLVRHYKRKHPDDYHLLSQEGYLNGLLKHVSETQGYKFSAPNEDDKLADNQNNLDALPQDAVSALHSLSLGTCTVKEYELLKEKGLIKTNDKSVEIDETQQVVITDESNILQTQAILPEEQLIAATDVVQGVAEQVNLNLNNQVNLIQTSEGTINLNNIQGLPQTLQTLEGNEGQIVILQIVEATDQIATQLSQGEIIQQVQVGTTSEPITIQQHGVLQGTEQIHIQDIQTSVPGEVRIVNFPETLDVVTGAAGVQQGSILEIPSLSGDGHAEHITVTNDPIVEGTIQIVEGGIVENEDEIHTQADVTSEVTQMI